jgi:hypothetical protein
MCEINVGLGAVNSSSTVGSERAPIDLFKSVS